jgi:uncharacterized protein YabE (DUF348 family)
VPAVPGINEVWSLVSGTRSNPPHHPAHGAPYPAGEGTSEAAEYYYEDQYDQQQYPYDRFPGSSAGYGPAAYEQQGEQGYATGYEPGAHPEYAAYEEYGGHPEYAGFEAPGGQSGQYFDVPSEYPAAMPYESSAQYTPEPSYGDSTAEIYGVASLLGPAGNGGGGTGTATRLLTAPAPAPTATLVEAEPETEAAPRPEPSPAATPSSAPASTPRRGRAGSGRGPVLRTRPRTGPLGRIVQGTVLAALVAGAVTYVAYDKTITLSIDGQTQTVHTFAGTVGAVLTADDVATGSKDIVSPAPGSSASSGQTITVRYGRPLSLSVDGVTRQTWVHYPTVAGALAELGVRTAGAKTSDPLTAQIPRSGLNGLVVYTMRHITILVDGKTLPLQTTAASVSDALSQAGIVLHNQDAPSVPGTSVPTDGETISVNRIFGSTETKQVSIPYKTTQVQNPNAYTGTTSVTTQGVDGEETITYALLTVNGVQQAPKQVSAVVTKQPVNEVVSVGTKSLPSSAASLNWAALANCESGGNPSENTGNGFYGMYQFTIGTWDSLGGSGLPSNASAATQTALAEKLYSEAGAGQWPVCGHYLFS